MLSRRRLLAVFVLPALIAPAAALAQGAGEKKKGGGITYIQFPTLTATIFRGDGHRGVLTVEVGVDVPNSALRARTNLSMPRLRAAYVELLQSYVYSLGPGAPPDPDYLSVALQRQTDRVLGQPGAHLLLGAMLVN
ncbi:MAG TPA: Tat pathway signal protein [Caulobacteraceae bacterium]|jgi:hypothetical protein|nr:Tat pathway signal protein [Caulobacteraceae bacterium]